MIGRFTVSDDYLHAGFVKYGDRGESTLRFDTYSGANINSANVRRGIEELTRDVGTRNDIGAGLKTAEQELFTSGNGMRTNSIKVRATHLVGRGVGVGWVLSVFSRRTNNIGEVGANRHEFVLDESASGSGLTLTPFIVRLSSNRCSRWGGSSVLRGRQRNVIASNGLCQIRICGRDNNKICSATTNL